MSRKLTVLLFVPPLTSNRFNMCDSMIDRNSWRGDILNLILEYAKNLKVLKLLLNWEIWNTISRYLRSRWGMILKIVTYLISLKYWHYQRYTKVKNLLTFCIEEDFQLFQLSFQQIKFNFVLVSTGQEMKILIL